MVRIPALLLLLLGSTAVVHAQTMAGLLTWSPPMRKAATFEIIGSVDHRFDPSAYAAVNRFGTLQRKAISRTRLPTGEAGSSRQIQLAANLVF